MFSNETIYKPFFGKKQVDSEKLQAHVKRHMELNRNELDDNYVSDNYGDKCFRFEDAKLIGFIREELQREYDSGMLNEREFSILLAEYVFL